MEYIACAVMNLSEYSPVSTAVGVVVVVVFVVQKFAVVPGSCCS